MLPSGELTGFDIDVTKALCVEMGANCEIVNQAFDGLIPALNAKKIDAIIASMLITPERLEAIDFAGPYYSVPALFVAARTPASRSPGRARGQERRRAARNHHGELRRAELPRARIQIYDTSMRRISTSPAAGSIWSSPTSVPLHEFLKTPDGAGFAVVGEPIYDAELLGTGAGIGIRKGDTALKEKFDTALAAMIASGEYKTINDKYISVDIAPK